MSRLAKEIVRKDTMIILKNKRLMGLMLLVPVVLTIIMPTIFIVSVGTTNINFEIFSTIFDKILKVDIRNLSTYEQRELIVSFFINNILPIFFMLIPTMSSSIISANSFVGEKERGTLETLYLSPIKASDIFIAKVSVSLLLSTVLNVIVFVLMCMVLNLILILCGFSSFIPGIKWLVMILIAGLAITILATTFVINKSKKSNTAEEAQQSAVFIILPIIALVVGQFTGLIFINNIAVIIASIILLCISIITLFVISKKINYNL